MFCIVFLSILTVLNHASANEGRSFVLPQGSGPFRSELTISELVDQSRDDPFNASHVRRIMTSRFDPVPAKLCKLNQVPYFTPRTAGVENEILAEYGYPPIFDRFVLEVCKKTNQGENSKRGKFPIALYSPGINTTRLFASSIAQELTSHGFITITIDHPYDVDVVEFPNGDVIFGGHVTSPVNANGSTASVEHALEVRAQDISFLLDTLGVERNEKVVMFGHSFGGAAAATSMLHDKRIRAGVNMDGTMFGPVLTTPLGPRSKQAFILWGSSGHNTTTDESWGQFWSNLQQSPNVDYAKELSIFNSAHGSYWDLNILVDVAGIRDELSELAQSLVGPTGPGTRVLEILGRYLSGFFKFSLGQRPEDVVFKGPSDKFPEVIILRD